MKAMVKGRVFFGAMAVAVTYMLAYPFIHSELLITRVMPGMTKPDVLKYGAESASGAWSGSYGEGIYLTYEFPYPWDFIVKTIKSDAKPAKAVSIYFKGDRVFEVTCQYLYSGTSVVRRRGQE